MSEHLEPILCPEFRKYIDKDTTLVIDADTPLFKAASIAEEVSIVFRSEEYGFEQEFKNKTEFKGRTRVVTTEDNRLEGKIGEGSWLANRNLKRKTEGLEEWELSKFQFEEVQRVRMNIGQVRGIFHDYIESIKQQLGINKVLLLVGGTEEEFRPQLALPYEYKGNRKGKTKPILLSKLKTYVRSLDNAMPASGGMESDDWIGIFGTKGYADYLKTGKFSYVVSSIDKDQCQHPCLLFNYQKDDSGAFMYPTPMLIEDTSRDLGNLYMKGSKVLGWGYKWLMCQMLIGDWSTDGFSPVKHLGLKKGVWGDKKAYTYLQPLDTVEKLTKAVYGKYEEWAVDGVFKFTDWRGDEQEDTILEFADKIWTCCYMRRSPNDERMFSDLVEKYCEVNNGQT